MNYQTKGTCSRGIQFQVDEQGRLTNVSFDSGCAGNLQGIAALVEGMPVEEVVRRLKGIQCRNKTSCPDQLALALEQHLAQKAGA